jgi:methionyl-tRNA formyltransferase
MRGTASRVLPALCKNKSVDVVKVVLAHGESPNRKRSLRHKISKTFKIGFLGSLNGIRMRDWYSDNNTDSIVSLCDSFDIELSETPFINSKRTRELFKEANADLGLSLGNGYIPKSVFSIPKHGMVNIHTEILPEFQGAQSIIWPIYEGSKETGFTIHQIDNKIDTGDILLQERYPIQPYSRLRETVEKNLMTARVKIPDAFSYVCQNYVSLKAEAISQANGKSYTTPSIWQFIRMVRNHRAMYKESLTNKVRS